MTELIEAIQALTALGWSEYESKTYSALVLQGKTTASQIAKKSQVPANRVYQILEKLTAKGHVKRVVARGSPSFYEAVNPHEVLENNKSTHEKKINEAKNALSKLKEREDDTDIPKTYTIIGNRELKVNLQEMILKADKNIYFSVDTLIEISNNELTEILNEKNETCNINILTTPRGINDIYEKEVMENINEIAIRVTEDSFSTILLVADSDKILFVSYAYPNDELENREYFGVFLEDKKTTKMFERMFKNSWDNAVLPD